MRSVLITILATLAAGFHELGLASWMLYAFLTLVPSFNYVVFPCVQVCRESGEKAHDKFCEGILSLLLEMLAGPHLRRAEGTCLRFRLARMQALPSREGTIHIRLLQPCLTIFTQLPCPTIYDFENVICE